MGEENKVKNDGKQLEQIVKKIEQYFLPNNFKISPNVRCFNENKTQIAEFDIEIEGWLGTTFIKWLIECRDRPSEGPAPGSWIEQLVGRRERFNFNKVTAVSTTSFAEGAIEYASKSDIEIRTVKEITLDSIAHWFPLSTLTLIDKIVTLFKVDFSVDQKEIKISEEEFKSVYKKYFDPKKQNLYSIKTGETVRSETVLYNILRANPNLYDDRKLIEGPDKKTMLKVNFPSDDDHYVVVTELGNIRIREILFWVELSIKETEVPVDKILQYDRDVGSETISQSVNFKVNIGSQKLNVGFHRVLEKSETFISVDCETT